MLDNDAFRALRLGNIEAFQRHILQVDEFDLSDANLKGVDLREIDVSRLKLRGAYLREADIRGQDLRGIDLDGCSLRNAKISGVWFDERYSAEEIRMSIQYGTRLRPTDEAAQGARRLSDAA